MLALTKINASCSIRFGAWSLQREKPKEFQTVDYAECTYYPREHPLGSPKIILKHPLPIASGLDTALMVLGDIFPDRYMATKALLQTLKTNILTNPFLKHLQTSGLLGWGSNAMTFDIPGQRALKLCSYNPMQRPVDPDFDLPVYASGDIGENFYYIQPKATFNATPEQIQALRERIFRKGYALIDFGNYRQDQVAMVNGKAYLADFDAVYIPIAKPPQYYWYHLKAFVKEQLFGT
jgi:hypothetical protein